VTSTSCPAGWTVERRRRDLLCVRRDVVDALRDAGLGSADDWRDLLERAPGGTGRGATARLELAGGLRAIVKKMRRGGLAARLWRDRFAGTRRLLANLTVAEEAKRRRIATPAPLALCLRTDLPGLYQAWLMTEEIARARDLLSVMKEGASPPGVLEAAMGLVRRMHDAGLHHRDLNLGNLLVRE
jgi:3-deoxy-D-manno-octulosonic acid kinase